MFSKAVSGEGLYRSGFNCAQAVLTTFCWRYGLNRELGSRLACGLGGGLCAGEVCGAVSAGVLVIGLKYGNTLAADTLSKQRCRKQTRQFLDAFTARHGSILCRELSGRVSRAGETANGQTNAQLSRTVCPGLVADAIRLLEAAGC